MQVITTTTDQSLATYLSLVCVTMHVLIKGLNIYIDNLYRFIHLEMFESTFHMYMYTYVKTEAQ